MPFSLRTVVAPFIPLITATPPVFQISSELRCCACLLSTPPLLCWPPVAPARRAMLGSRGIYPAFRACPAMTAAAGSR